MNDKTNEALEVARIAAKQAEYNYIKLLIEEVLEISPTSIIRDVEIEVYELEFDKRWGNDAFKEMEHIN